MTDYGKGKIYKIVVNNTEDEYRPYIGSTTKEYLSQRFVQHKSKYKKSKIVSNILVSSFKLFDKYGIENCEIVLIENYPCATKDELRARERYWFDNIENCNINRPAIFESDKNEMNIQKYKRALELHPEFYKQRYQRQLCLHLDYNEKRYARKLELHPNFNKEQDAKIKQNKYTCECGIHIRCDSKSKHIKSKKHLNYIATIAIQQEV
jgi:hypothetical protein